MLNTFTINGQMDSDTDDYYIYKQLTKCII